MSPVERDATARRLIKVYNNIGLEAGYNEDHSIVTAYISLDFAFCEEDLSDTLSNNSI